MAMYRVGEVLAEKYEIKAILGAGGMGTVYLARQIDLGRDVAIKVPLPEALEIPGFLARFTREAKTVAKLLHDNIVQVYEYTNTDDLTYIVMEYVEGHDLKNLIQSTPTDLKVRDVATILRSSCEGLAHAHEFGIVHRDIKPHNIMVEKRGRGKWRVKIMDFGIAHLAQNANMTMNQEQLTVTGQAIGTPSYMSPEQIRGIEVTPQSDIYSFGCVVYYVFAQTTPFVGTGFTVAAAHLSEQPPQIRSRVPQLPEPLEAIVERCLRKDASQRPEDASDLGQELYEALESIFDLDMKELWPAPSQGEAGTDLIKPTVPVERNAPTVAGDTLAPGETAPASAGAGATVVDRGGPDVGAVSAPRPRGASSDATLTDTDRTAADASAKAAPESAPGVGEPTGKFDRKPAEASPSMSDSGVEASAEPVSAQPGMPVKKIVMILAAVLVPLLVVGVGVGVMLSGTKEPPPEIVNNGSNGGNNGGLVELPVDDPGIGSVVNPAETPEPETTTVTPTQTPVRQAEVTPRRTEVPVKTPVPSPVVDPAVARTKFLQDRFDRSEGLVEKAQRWSDAVYDLEYGSAAPMKMLAQDFAKRIAVSPEMISIPSRRYTVGSAEGDGASDEHPQRSVILDGFEIGRYEVTALAFSAYLNSMPREAAEARYRAAPDFNIQYDEARGAYLPVKGKEVDPVNGISWEAANAYTLWLSQQVGESYRLPTEAEWEVAAHAGDNLMFPWGSNAPDQEKANFNRPEGGTVSVTSMKAGTNRWGLHHMAGNVAEWCLDWYESDAYEKAGTDNPLLKERPGTSRPRRVLRGGSFMSTQPEELRTTRRGRWEPDNQEPFIGFRVVKESN